MEKKIYTDNFERLLKEKSDEFRMYPSKRVWHSIYNDLHPGRKWPSIAMSMVLVAALLFIGYLNTNNNTVKTSVAAAPGSTQGRGHNNSTPESDRLPVTGSEYTLNADIAGLIQDIYSEAGIN